MRPLTALMACSLAAMSTAGCGDIDGSSAAFPGTILYMDPNGGFELRLLQPPWIPPFYYAPVQTTYSVVPPVTATVTADPLVLLAEALYSLQIWKVSGDPATAMQAVQVTIPGGATSVPVAVVSTADNTSGVEIAWGETETVFHRDAFLAGPGTPTFRLHFTAQQPIADDDMVLQMINSFRAK